MLRNSTEKLNKGTLFNLFLKLEEIHFIFLYLYVYCLFNCGLCVAMSIISVRYSHSILWFYLPLFCFCFLFGGRVRDWCVRVCRLLITVSFTTNEGPRRGLGRMVVGFIFA